MMLSTKMANKTLKLVLRIYATPHSAPNSKMVSMLRIGMRAFRRLCPSKKICTKQVSTVYTQVQVVLHNSYTHIFLLLSHGAKQLDENFYVDNH